MFRLVQTGDGQLYVGTERGAFKREGERFVPLSAHLPEDGVPSLARDASGAMWVGSVNHGLMRLGKDNVEQFSSQRGLPNNRVAALFVDREGSIWAGTNAGLLRLRDAPFSTYNGEHGLSDDYVRALAESRDGSLWIGTSRGLNRWQGNKLAAVYTSADGLPGDSILSLLETADGSLWAGTYVSGLMRLRNGSLVEHFDTAGGMPGSNQIRALAQASDGSLWIGTSRGLIHRKDGEFRLFGADQGLPRDFILSLHIARDGAVWVGTANGAARVVGAQIVPIDVHAMNNAQDVFDFHEDGDGTMWIATDRGLVRYRNGKMQALGLGQGLPVDTIFQVIDDQAGSFWLTSNRGVMRVSRRDADAVLAGTRTQLSVDQFGEADGLASSQCNGGSGPAALRDREGHIWVATARGAAVVDPSLLHSYRRQLPPVVIEQLLVDDRVFAPQDKLVLAGRHAQARVPLRRPQLPHATPAALPASARRRGRALDRTRQPAFRAVHQPQTWPLSIHRRRFGAGIGAGLESGQHGDGARDQAAVLAAGLVPSRCRTVDRPAGVRVLPLAARPAAAACDFAGRDRRPAYPRPARAHRSPAGRRRGEKPPVAAVAGQVGGVRTAGSRGCADRPPQSAQPR